MNEKLIQKRSAKERILITDGATGTSLQQRGLTRGVPPEKWVLEKPQEIIQLHKDFIDAGAEIILTCTFGASPLRLSQNGLGEKTDEINKKAVELAKQAVGEREILIAASIGPTGHMMKPFGDLDEDAAFNNFQVQALSLVNTGVDFFLVETQFDITEAEIAIKAIQSVGSLPIICSFSYDRGTRTMMGVSPTQTAIELEKYELAALGINCGKNLQDNLETLKLLGQATDLPIWFKPNAGLPKVDGSGNPYYDMTPEAFASFAKDWVNAGANYIGGCCGTSPEHLKRIAKIVEETNY